MCLFITKYEKLKYSEEFFNSAAKTNPEEAGATFYRKRLIHKNIGIHESKELSLSKGVNRTTKLNEKEDLDTGFSFFLFT